MKQAVSPETQNAANEFWIQHRRDAEIANTPSSQVYEQEVIIAATRFIQIMTGTPLALIAAMYDPFESANAVDGKTYSSEGHLGTCSAAISLAEWFIKQMKSQMTNISADIMEECIK